jgi:hypothetical protein
MDQRKQESGMRASAVLLTLSLASLLFGLVAVGCAPSGQGDPCTPEAIPAGGFSSMEVYVETSSVQCRTRVCMVYRLTGSPQCPAGSSQCTPPSGMCLGGTPPTSLCLVAETPGTISTDDHSPDRVFCTCRCSAGGNASLPLCHCTDGYRCVPDSDPGGGYCVPNELGIAAGLCFSDSECPGAARGSCDPTTHHCG